MRFAEVAATATRELDGQLSTRLTDPAGNEVARLRVHRIGEERDDLEFTLPDGTTTHARRRSGLRPTLDWSAEQAYSLWKDRDSLRDRPLEWQDTLIRPAGAPKRDVHADALQSDTEWFGGFSATAIKKIGTHVSYASKRQTTGPVFISSFKKDGVEVGFAQWWPQERAFAWSFPGLTDGYVDAGRLRDYGGWTFTPDMPWMNMQVFAFYQFHGALNTRGAVSQRREGWLERMGALVSPRLLANEPGCDYLHWLDGSIFRPCCDSHDRCYAKEEPACGAYSWWMWWWSWQCTGCNIATIFCFGSSAGSHVLSRFP
jgi:hypothetical protein